MHPIQSVILAALTCIALIGIAIVDLVIVAEFLKKRMIVSALVIMVTSFVVALVWISDNHRLTFTTFFLVFFWLPPMRLWTLFRSDQAETRSGKIYKWALSAVFAPSVFGLVCIALAAFIV